MHRIDTATALADANGVGKDGFQNGTPSTSTPATALNAAWCNSVQEEVALAIEGLGLTLDSSNDQLLEAIRNPTVNDANPAVHVKNSGAGYGFVAEADTTSPARAALRVVPQNADPITSPAKGDHYVNDQTGLMRGFQSGTTWLRYIANAYTMATTSDSHAGNTWPVYFQKTGTDIEPTIPANSLAVGSTIRIRAAGEVVLDADASPTTLAIGVYVESSAGVYTFVGNIRWASPTASTSYQWYIDLTGTVTTIGAGGGVRWATIGGFSTATGSDGTFFCAANTAGTSMDMTNTSIGIKVKVSMATTADAGDSAEMDTLVVDIS